MKPTVYFDNNRPYKVKKGSPATIFVVVCPYPRVREISLRTTTVVLKRKGLSFETAEAFYEPMSKQP